MLKILIPLDGSELAERMVPHAIALASPFEVKVTLLRIITPDEFRSEDAFSQANWRLSRYQAQTYLQGIAQSFKIAGIACELCVEEGRPAEVILSKIRELDAHLLVLSTHGRGEATDFPSGGVVSKVLSKFDRSVLLVRGIDSSSFKKKVLLNRIIVPIDGSHESRCALRIAMILAEATNALLVVACIAVPPVLSQLVKYDNKASVICRKLEELTRAAAEHLLEDVRAEMPPGVKSQSITILNGSPSRAINDKLRPFNGDLLVASECLFEGEPGTRGVLTAGAPAPILVLSPNGIGKAFSKRRVTEVQELTNADVS